ncbi:MAG TPA: hypothetical protein VF856_02385 [Gemmatimonadaceae bacterium]
MFKPATKFQILFWLSALNLIFLGYALPNVLHAAGHGLLALGFGLWARRVRPRFGGDEEEAPPDALGSDNDSRFDNLGAEVNQLRQQLSETQERLDFAERLLMKEREARH